MLDVRQFAERFARDVLQLPVVALRPLLAAQRAVGLHGRLATVRAALWEAHVQCRLHRDRRANRGMGIVADQLEVLEAKVADLLHLTIELHAWKRTEAARQLLARLLEMVLIQM